jgi:hypothetical protein
MQKFDPEYLLRASENDVKVVMEQAKAIRSNHFYGGRKGMTKDKSRRLVARFPIEIMFHPEYGKYFDPAMDAHERRKGIQALLRMFPEFQTVEKL